MVSALCIFLVISCASTASPPSGDEPREVPPEEAWQEDEWEDDEWGEDEWEEEEEEGADRIFLYKEAVVSGFYSSIGVHGLLADRVSSEQLDKARATMQMLGIDALQCTPLRAMSTGQQRRCLLGRALVHEPKTLILDEPTEGLDFAASFDYLRRIRDLSAAGRNIVLVTHHLNEIPPEVDRVILLQNGRIAADGPKTEVLTADRLSEVYASSIRVAEIDGYYLAYPDVRP